MTTCKHCGRRIVQTNWYDGPGWMHEGTRSQRCEPVTVVEPIEPTGQIVDRAPIKLSWSEKI